MTDCKNPACLLLAFSPIFVDSLDLDEPTTNLQNLPCLSKFETLPNFETIYIDRQKFIANCNGRIHVCQVVYEPLKWQSARLLLLGNTVKDNVLYCLPKSLLSHILSFIEYSLRTKVCDLSFQSVISVQFETGASFVQACKMCTTKLLMGTVINQ